MDACRDDRPLEFAGPAEAGALDGGAGAVAAGAGVEGRVAAGVVGADALEVSGNAWVSVRSVGPVRVVPRAADVNGTAAAVTAHTMIVIAQAR